MAGPGMTPSRLRARRRRRSGDWPPLGWPCSGVRPPAWAAVFGGLAARLGRPRSGERNMGFAWVNGDGHYDVLLADLPPLPGPASAAGIGPGTAAGAGPTDAGPTDAGTTGSVGTTQGAATTGGAATGATAGTGGAGAAGRGGRHAVRHRRLRVTVKARRGTHGRPGRSSGHDRARPLARIRPPTVRRWRR
jgi:hypothetical protein